MVTEVHDNCRHPHLQCFCRWLTAKISTHVCRAWLMFRSSSIGRETGTHGKPGVASMARTAGIAAEQTRRGLRTQPTAILRSV